MVKSVLLTTKHFCYLYFTGHNDSGKWIVSKEVIHFFFVTRVSNAFRHLRTTRKNLCSRQNSCSSLSTKQDRLPDFPFSHSTLERPTCKFDNSKHPSACKQIRFSIYVFQDATYLCLVYNLIFGDGFQDSLFCYS